MATLRHLACLPRLPQCLTKDHCEHLRTFHRLISATQISTTRRYSDNAPQSSNGNPQPLQKLSFEEYRKLRKSLKWRSRIAGLPMGLVALSISSAVNVHFNPDMFNPQPETEIQPILGMDPVIFAVACGAVSGLAGFAVGGVIFSNVWRLTFSKLAKQIKERDEDFLARLHKHRYSRFDQSKYDDDYYAEKVMTLSDYRQWIRQQQMKRQRDEELMATTSDKQEG